VSTAFYLGRRYPKSWRLVRRECEFFRRRWLLGLYGWDDLAADARCPGRVWSVSRFRVRSTSGLRAAVRRGGGRSPRRPAPPSQRRRGRPEWGGYHFTSRPRRLPLECPQPFWPMKTTRVFRAARLSAERYVESDKGPGAKVRSVERGKGSYGGENVETTGPPRARGVDDRVRLYVAESSRAKKSRMSSAPSIGRRFPDRRRRAPGERSRYSLRRQGVCFPRPNGLRRPPNGTAVPCRRRD